MQDQLMRDTVILSIVDALPNQSHALCSKLVSEVARSRCLRFQQRPHLWTIAPAASSQTTWRSGRLGERLFFPYGYPVKPFSPALSISCGEQTKAVCIEKKALAAAQQGDEVSVASFCLLHETQRSVRDCFFTAAEALPVELYSKAISLCLNSGSYGPECHNHLVLRAAVEGWTDATKHKKFVDLIKAQWVDYPEYGKQIVDVYWSIVAARVAGMIQPFEAKVFVDFPAAFAPHLRSAIALRVIHQQHPFKKAQEVRTGGSHSLPKAHGPNSPVFQPRPLWRNTEEGQWVYFCDIRGGMRPYDTDPTTDMDIAVLTALAMRNPPAIQFIQAKASNSKLHPVVQEILAALR